MRRIAAASIGAIVMPGLLGACAGARDADVECIEIAKAKVCGAVEDARLVMSAEGLKAGSLLRIQLEDAGPAQLTVSENGTLLPEAGSRGFLSYDGTFGKLSIEATAADGTPIVGEILLG